jgi:hypothetical protein
VVRDALLQADYVQMAPGTKTRRQFQPDNPIWWIVQGGAARFTIEGQEPICRDEGLPRAGAVSQRLSDRSVWQRPALFFEVTVANSPTMYPRTRRRCR